METTIKVKCECKMCIACGDEATRTNNTLCQRCWYDAEGVDGGDITNDDFYER